VQLAIYDPAFKDGIIPSTGCHVKVVGPTPTSTTTDLHGGEEQKKQITWQLTSVSNTIAVRTFGFLTKEGARRGAAEAAAEQE
jgi:hypothetical protein